MSQKEELKIKSYIPMHDQVKLTAYRYESHTKLTHNKGSNILSMSEMNNEVKPYQKVLAVGPTARDLEVGDWVLLDVNQFRTGRKNNSNMEETADALGATRNYQPIEIETNKETENGEVILCYARNIALKFVPDDEQ